ncbi:decapping and exoribonuclease protein [Aplysia californica]|uniref:Decapping nuclease n=1 Tax=Aplysia californica TaxID=6500 RepID=A0ABM0K7X7_APLCA|nr:decapping and exoribonuclease protein [Aplysia californica]
MMEAAGPSQRSTSRARLSALSTDPSNYNKSFPDFTEPREIGKFSIDAEGEFRHDAHQLKIYCSPQNPGRCQFDLTVGIDNMILREEIYTEKFKSVLRWIMEGENASLMGPAGESAHLTDRRLHRLSADFVCTRGLLSRLLVLPFERNDELALIVTKFRGTYFLCEVNTPKPSYPMQEEMSKWGYKFEQYVTADKETGEPDLSKPINTNEHFYSVLRSQIGPHSLVCRGEVDCEDLTREEGDRYVELKTSVLQDTPKRKINFLRFKLIKWWAQSVLAGVSVVMCGFRDNNGMVRSLESYEVKEMPALAKNPAVTGPWTPNVCFNFLEAFFDFVKANITEDNENCAYVFRGKSDKVGMTFEKRENEEEFKFLPDWFINWDAWDNAV